MCRPATGERSNNCGERGQAEDSLATSIAAGSMEWMPPVQLKHRNERIERHDALFDTN
jgi:hypothetical protein